jgi:hypothetical protein
MLRKERDQEAIRHKPEANSNQLIGQQDVARCAIRGSAIMEFFYWRCPGTLDALLSDRLHYPRTYDGGIRQKVFLAVARCLYRVGSGRIGARTPDQNFRKFGLVFDDA